MQWKLYGRLLGGAALAVIAAAALAQTADAQTVDVQTADSPSPESPVLDADSSEPEKPAEEPEAVEESDYLTLDPIRVTRPRAPLEEAQEELDLRAGGTSVIGAEDFEDGRATTLSDVLSFAPGVLTQTRHGEETRLSIRGSGIQRGFQLRGVQLYQDGIPLNLADGSGDFQSIDPLAIDFVEIWRGGSALEYGSSTLGGAINFVTPTGRTVAPLTVRLDAGSFGLWRGSVQAGGAHGDFDGIVGFTAGKQDGWRDQSATRAKRASANFGYSIDETLEARLFLNSVDSELELPGPLSLAQVEDDPDQAGRNYSELDASNDYILKRAAGRLAWAPAADSEVIASVFYFERDRNHPTIFGILDQDVRNMGFDVRGVLDFAETDAARRLVVGVSAARYLGKEDRFTNDGGEPGTYRGRTDLDGRTYVAYGEYSHGLSDALTVQVGAQLTRADRELDNEASPTRSYDETFYGLSPKLGLLYDLDEANQLYTSVSRSFEPAPFGEARVLPDLPLPDPQEATTYEIGWRHRSERLNLEAAAYYSKIDNEFLALVDENGASLGTTNADATLHRGFEVGASLLASETVTLQASYLWSDFRFDDDAAFGDNQIAGIPPHSLNARLLWTPLPWLTITPMVEWRGGETWIDHANSVKDDGYTLLHLGFSGELPDVPEWDVEWDIEWFVDIRNLTDQRYISTTLVRDDVNGLDTVSYFPGEPRSIFGGIRWRY